MKRDAPHRALLHAASWLAPGQLRAEWLAEWSSELWYVQRSCPDSRDSTAFCLGAFKDALLLRRNTPLHLGHGLGLESPWQCGFLLAACAAVSLCVVLLLPEARKALLPTPYRDNLVLVSTAGQVRSESPTIPLAQYRWLNARTLTRFVNLAFYQPLTDRVQVSSGKTADLSVIRASDNLFELLHVPVWIPLCDHGTRPYTATLVMTRHAWRTYFDADPRIVGRVIDVAGQAALVAGLVAEDSWRLPGRADVWLLEDQTQMAGLPPGSSGFVVGEVRPSHNPNAGWRWDLSVPNEAASYTRFECGSLAGLMAEPTGLLIFTILWACLVFPATTSLSLGEYSANRASPAGLRRLRQWMFLAIKIVPILVMLYCWLLICLAVFPPSDLAWMPGVSGVAAVFAFRWVLMDQRQRCPVCLRLLANPIRVGQPSRTFIESDGTELMCTRGHGLLYVPETPTSWFRAPRWRYLDSSWSSLF